MHMQQTMPPKKDQTETLITCPSTHEDDTQSPQTSTFGDIPSVTVMLFQECHTHNTSDIVLYSIEECSTNAF